MLNFVPYMPHKASPTPTFSLQGVRGLPFRLISNYLLYMKPLIRQLLLGSVAALTFASCADESPWGSTTAEGSISIRINPSDKVSSVVPQVRSTSPIPSPKISDFKIVVTNKDKNLVYRYDNIEKFAEQSSVAVGNYSIEVQYGDENSQGLEDHSGDYTKSFFYGMTDDIRVTENSEQTVNLEANLRNSVLEIDYSEEFRSYFSGGDFETTLQCQGKQNFTLSKTDSELGRRAYVIPGKIAITIKAVLQNGNPVSLSAGEVTAEANCYHKLHYTVNEGKLGVPQLVIEFDDALKTEPVTIDISEELSKSLPPTIEPEGFENNQSFALPNGTPVPEDWKMQFNVKSVIGLKHAILSVNSDALPVSGNFLNSIFTQNRSGNYGEIDLCEATDAQKSALESAGILAKGFTDASSRFAFVDLKGATGKLPEGEHVFTLTASDEWQTSEPVSLVIAPFKMEFDITQPSAADYDVFDASQNVSIDFSYNGLDPTVDTNSNPFTFAVLKNTEYKVLENVSLAALPGTKSDFASKNYRATFNVPEELRNCDKIYVFMLTPSPDIHSKPLKEVNMPYSYPEYNVEVDAFAKFAKVRITPANVANKVIMTLEDGTPVTGQPDASGIITILNLKPEQSLKLKARLAKDPADTKTAKTLPFTTEAAAQVPNNDFQQVLEHNKHKIESINAGGYYKITLGGTHINTSTISYDEPNGWATINSLTCYTGSNPQNTWFMVPSTMMEQGAVLLRNVAYSHNGSMPAEDNQGTAGLGKYYSRKAPASFEYYRAGELFLGSYSYNGSENRSEGITFTSRPKSLTFDYKYSPKGDDNDVGDVVITVVDANGNTLSSKYETLGKQDSYISKTINLPSYDKFGTKASKLIIKFRSSTAQSPKTVVPTDLKDIASSQATADSHIETNKYKSLSTGSELVIDNVVLNY